MKLALNQYFEKNKTLFYSAIFTVFVLLMTFTLGKAKTGSYYGALALVRGEELRLDAQQHKLGLVSPGSEKIIKCSVTNLTSRRVRLVGSRSSCACTEIISKFPDELSPFGHKDYTLKVSVPKRGKEFYGSVEIFTDSAKQPRITINYSGLLP